MSQPRTIEEIATLFVGMCAGVEMNREVELKGDIASILNTLAWCLGARILPMEMFFKLSLENLQSNPEAIMSTAESLCHDFEKEMIEVTI